VFALLVDLKVAVVMVVMVVATAAEIATKSTKFPLQMAEVQVTLGLSHFCIPGQKIMNH
jgi:hypothetical protein